MNLLEIIQLQINEVLGQLIHAGSSASSNLSLQLGWF